MIILQPHRELKGYPKLDGRAENIAFIQIVRSLKFIGDIQVHRPVACLHARFKIEWQAEHFKIKMESFQN